MNDDELGRVLSGAFDAHARHDVDDATMPPPPRFATEPAPHGRQHRVTRIAAPLMAAAAVIAVVALLGGIMNRPSRSSHRAAASRHTSGTSLHPLAGAPVHIRLQQKDGVQVGVGMPVIAYFSRKFTDARALSAATSVSVDGKPAQAVWYFEASAADRAYPIEGHLRLQHYWRAHATVQVAIASRGVSAGRGMSFDDDLSLAFTTGAAMIATVDDVTHRMSVSKDGAAVGSYPVSLGIAGSPTLKGVKVIMEQGGKPICMSGINYSQCDVKYIQRLTYAGEYLHSAPWNLVNIGHRDTSNGCTNLKPADAKRLYKLFEVGDVVQYPNASGPTMKLGSGYGDWNVSWATWQTGGLVPTS